MLVISSMGEKYISTQCIRWFSTYITCSIHFKIRTVSLLFEVAIMWGKVLDYIGTYISNLQIVIFGPSVWIVLFKMLISVMAFWFLYRLLLWWCLYHVLIIVIISMGHLTLNWAVIHICFDGTPQLCVCFTVSVSRSHKSLCLE